MEGISLIGQLTTFCYSIVLGLICGLIYDVFRLLRIAFRCGAILVFLTDIIFWLLCAFLTYSFLLCFTDGTVRFYVLIAAAAGFIIYLLTIGKLTRKVFLFVFKPFKAFFRLIRRIFFKKSIQNPEKIQENPCKL